MQNPDSLP